METENLNEIDDEDVKSRKKRKICLLICIILILVMMLPSTIAFLAIF